MISTALPHLPPICEGCRGVLYIILDQALHACMHGVTIAKLSFTKLLSTTPHNNVNVSHLRQQYHWQLTRSNIYCRKKSTNFFSSKKQYFRYKKGRKIRNLVQTQLLYIIVGRSLGCGKPCPCMHGKPCSHSFFHRVVIAGYII